MRQTYYLQKPHNQKKKNWASSKHDEVNAQLVIPHASEEYK